MIEIDISKVPPEKQSHPSFIQLRAALKTALTNQRWVAAFSIHEAGHAIYFERAGIAGPSFIGPRIVYNEQQDLTGGDPFDGYPAAVHFSHLETSALASMKGDDWILALAKAHAAGGVAVKKLTNAPHTGNEEDYDNLCKTCGLICSKHPEITIDRPALWKLAQDLLEIDFRSPAFRKKVHKKASEIKLELFGVS